MQGPIWVQTDMTSRKLERTLNLLAELLNAESPKSAAELKTRVGMYPEDKAAFRRTFDRDKNALRDMGVPLEIVPVPGTNPPVDGYIINKSDYYLADLNLSPAELRALNLASSSVEVLDGLSETEAIRKLGGYEENTASNVIQFPNSDDEKLSKLFDSITHRRTVDFVYGDKNRTLEPWRLEFTTGRWYLTGNNAPEMKVKTFRVDKISDLIPNDNAGEYDIPDNPPSVNLKPWSYGEGEGIETTIRIDKNLLAWARTSLDTEIEIDENGSGLAKVDVNNKEVFFARMALLLDHAEIIDPLEMRNEYLKHMSRFTEVPDGST